MIRGNYIIDFDSTITQVEALDIIADLILSEEDLQTRNQIQEITREAMQGRLSFDLALERRIDLLAITRSSIELLIARLKLQISPSFYACREKLAANRDRIFVVSGGFHEFIEPVIEELGLLKSQVYANRFIWSRDDKVLGFDKTSPLSRSGGKIDIARSLQLSPPVIVIGDGYTDYEIKKAGCAQAFYLYTENIRRPDLPALADREINAITEIFY